MKKAISLALALALATSLPAFAQNGFGQTPNTGGGFGGNTGGGFGTGTMAPPNTGFGSNTGVPQQDPNAALIAQLQQMTQLELQDYGVQPTPQLHDGAMHGPTPSSIPGARVITTAELFQLVMGGNQPYMIFDVLGSNQTLPGAVMAVNAAQPGSFQDQTQQGFGQFLQQVTGGRQDAALVFYCASTQCWMSYNAALRAVNLGYRNVLWYRGGLEAWTYAGLPTMPAGGGMVPGGGGMTPNMGGGGGMTPNMGGGMTPNMGGGMTPNLGGGGMMQPLGR